jgi:pimeloyl-ACP methyl ester carboxylesterase
VAGVVVQVWTGDTWEVHGLGAYIPYASPPYVPVENNSGAAEVAPIDFSDSAFSAFEGGAEYSCFSRLTQAILTCHYASTYGTGRRNTDNESGLGLLEKVERCRHIPCIAIHGRNDIVCPISTAYDLHQAWPEMELQVVPGAGHSQYEPRITHSLVTATYRMARLVMSSYSLAAR